MKKAGKRAARPGRQGAGGRRKRKVEGVRVRGRGKAPERRKSPPAKKRREGRPSILRDAGPTARKKILARVSSYAALGFTQAEIASMLGVADSTLRLWKDDPEFSAAIKNGKDKADALVIRSLYEQAIGGRKRTPNVVACIFWLKNRRPDLWKDKHDGTISGPVETGGKIIVEVVQVTSRKKEEPVTSGPAAAPKIVIAPPGKK